MLTRLGILGFIAAGTGSLAALYGLGTPQPNPVEQIAVAAPVTVSIRDVAYFVTHIDELRAKYQACENNPGIGAHDPECANAEEASMRVSPILMRRG